MGKLITKREQEQINKTIILLWKLQDKAYEMNQKSLAERIGYAALALTEMNDLESNNNKI